MKVFLIFLLMTAFNFGSTSEPDCDPKDILSKILNQNHQVIFPVVKVEVLSRGVYRVTDSTHRRWVVRFPSYKANPKKEELVSKFFIEIMGVRTSLPLVPPLTIAKKLVSEIKRLSPKTYNLYISSLSSGNVDGLYGLSIGNLSLANYIEGAVSGKDFLKSLDNFPGSTMQALQLVDKKIREQVSDFWLSCVMVLIKDCHEQNWVIKEGKLYAIDLAFFPKEMINPDMPKLHLLKSTQLPYFDPDFSDEFFNFILSDASPDFFRRIKNIKEKGLPHEIKKDLPDEIHIHLLQMIDFYLERAEELGLFL